MENEPKVIKLNDLQKREILRIFVNARRNKKDDAYIRREIRVKLNEYMKHYSEEDVQIIFRDCEMYMTVEEIYSTFMKKESEDKALKSKLNSNTGNMPKPNTSERFYEMAKDYIIDRYFDRGVDFLQEAGIVDDIVERFVKTKDKHGLEREILKDMTTFLQTLIGEDIDLEELKELKKDERYKDFVSMYIRRLLTRLPQEVSREQLLKEMIEGRLSKEIIDDSLSKYDMKRKIRREILVSDEEADQLLRGKLNLGIEFRDGIGLAQILGEDYVYSSDGTRNIKNSLVENMLLKIYRETRSIRFIQRNFYGNNIRKIVNLIFTIFFYFVMIEYF